MGSHQQLYLAPWRRTNLDTHALRPGARNHAGGQAIVSGRILLTPDDDVTCYEGATLTSAGNGFSATVTNNQHRVSITTSSHRATRYNFNPGVINFAIVFSTSQGNAAADGL
jgi:hypothetical protein